MAYTKFLHVFSTKQEHDTARSNGEGGEYHEPWVAYVNDSSKLVTYNKGWAEKYLTFEAIESGTFQFSNSGLSYSIDEGKTWTEIAQNTDTPTINAGDRIMFKATLTPEDYSGIGNFVSTSRYKAMGNPYSLLYGDAFESVRDLSGKNGALLQLFSGSTGLTSAENLSLPATTLANSCYASMFSDCTSLTTAPELPATTLVNFCYGSMFYGCTALTTASALPATTLAQGCYTYMFYGCTSLTAAPELPATTLYDNCYDYMFNGCTSLTTAPVLPATTLAEGCYTSMFASCTSLIIAPELPATTLADSCYASMFSGCTSLTTAPELPATTLDSYCYSNMFDGCTALTAAPELPATTLANGCYSGMFSDTRVLPDTSNIDFTSQSVISSNGLTGLFSKTIVTDSDLQRILPKNSQNKYCLPVTTLARNCYSYMFYGCTSLTTAPELPAKTLINGCYGSMFRGCTSLNYIKAMFTTTPSSTYTSNWVNGVASTGTFVKNSAATWNVTSVNGIPNGWTVETASE